MLNFTTQKEYQGSNIDQLTGLGTEFCTFNQARKIGAKVIKGSKAVCKLSRIVTQGKDNEFRSYSVFHQSQIEFRKESQ